MSKQPPVPREVEGLLRRAYAAFNTRDMEAVVAVLHPDVDWPNAWEGGRVQGREAVRDYWRRQFEVIDTAVEPTSFALDDDGRVIVHVHQVVRDRDGIIISGSSVQHVYRLQDGLISHMEVRDRPKEKS